MTEQLITTGIQVFATLLITLIGVLGVWLTSVLTKRYKIGTQTVELQNINIAQQEVVELAKQTVGELQQTMVDEFKAAHEDGKLTEDEIAYLRRVLKEKVQAKLSNASTTLLTAACVDISSLISGAAENWIMRLKA